MNKTTEEQQNKIAAAKTFIYELGVVQDLYYHTLMVELGLNKGEKTEEFLFDYIFNSGNEETFVEYMGRHGFWSQITNEKKLNNNCDILSHLNYERLFIK